MNSLINKSSLRKTTVALLTTLLIIAIAAPLLSFASAAPTATLGKSSGPNGTVISVSGTGFGVSESVSAISVSVDGHLAGLNVITTSAVAVPGMNPATTISGSAQLKTSATGVLSGSIILYGLTLGPHTVMISDATTSVLAGQFTVTAPSVTVSPSTLAAGASVIVSGSNFPTSTAIPSYYTNVIASASFAGTPIAVAAGSTTATPTTLSSNKVNSVATVSLPGITSGSAFTLTDAWGNVATTTLSLAATTVTLSPSSGPVGTVVTATVTGFGPSATISTVQVGNVVGSTSSATTAPTAEVTEQGTSVFLFTMPAGTTTTLAGVAGTQTVTVTDSLGNVGTATFTVTPKVILTLGASAVDSVTTYAPSSTLSAQVFITASGLKANAQLSFTASPLIPTQWITPSATWGVGIGTYSAITGKISTNANGQVQIVSDTATTPAAAGQYSITVSDGTNSVSTIITITTWGDIIAPNANDALSGAVGATVRVAYWGINPETILFDSTLVSTLVAAPGTWPAVTTNFVTITVPPAGGGLHQIKASIVGFNSIPYTVIAPTITLVSPSLPSVGTIVTVIGTGFSGTPAVLAIQGATVGAATDDVINNVLIATFALPNYIPGSYTLSLSDGVNSASTTFSIAAAQIQITPTTSKLGTLASPVKFAITGSGFAASEAITVVFDTTTISAPSHVGLSVINTNGGMLINEGYEIPTSAAAGPHTITVTGASGAWAMATFNIEPQLKALTAVRPGAQIIITGNGFAANSLQTLYVDGVVTTWLNTGVTPAVAIDQAIVKTGATGDLYTASSVGFVVPSTQAPGILNVTVKDAAGYFASTNLTVLGTPTITLGASRIVAGDIASSVSISGSGFTPGLRAFSANLYQGSTLITTITLTGSPVDVGATGAFATTAGLKFELPATVLPGEYTLRFTATSPTETADAAITVMGAPSMVAPTTAVSASNVSITVTGLSVISSATFGSVNLLPSAFGSTSISASGSNAFNTTTWFIVPTSLFAGTYLLTLTDSGAGLLVQSAITVTPAMTITPTSGAKGTALSVSATGFAASSAITAKINGQAVALSATTTDASGAISAATFTIPLTALATNNLTITDAAANTAIAAFALTTPTIMLTPSTAATGATVQIIGNGFTGSSPIVVQVGGAIVSTVPAALTTSGAGSFIAYMSVPAGLTGNVTVTAIDNNNNVGTEILTVGAGSGSTAIPNQTTMTNTAQTTTPSGIVKTTFNAGETVKAGFFLQSTGGSRDVTVAVTWQQGAKVYSMASFQTAMSTISNQVSFSYVLPSGAPGTWTATLQVYDGSTPLGVTTLAFTVS